MTEFLREIMSFPPWVIFFKIVWFLVTLYILFLVAIILWYHFSTDKEMREKHNREVGYDSKKNLPWWGWFILLVFTYFFYQMLVY
jgi:heme/copper-type cytochrome/quinol oxidase subunit 2